MTAAAVLGMGMTAGVVGLTAGVAGATTLPTAAKITAVSAPQIAKTGSNLAAGDLKLTLVSPTTVAPTSTITLAVAVANSATVHWYGTPTVSSSGVTVKTLGGAGTSTLTFKLGALAAKTAATVSVTGIHYTTTAAIGTITVTPTWKASTATPTYKFAATHTSAVNAYATKMTPPTEAAVTSVTATSTPNLKVTASGQAAGDWTIKFTTVTKGDGWNATETISLTVQNAATTNCSGASGYVLFTGTPTATVTATKTVVSATPTVKVATSAGTNCTAVSHNKVTVTFTNTGKFTSTTPAKNTAKIVLSGVKYHVAVGSTAAAALGYVKVTAKKTVTTIGTADTANPARTTGRSNANITSVYVAADTPAVTVSPGAYDASISPVKVVENTAGTVSAGYVCVGLDATLSTNYFNVSAAATASATGGNGTVTSKVFYENATGTKITSGNATFAVFEVKTASTTTPSTYVVSGLAVNASTHAGPVAAIVDAAGTASDCAGLSGGTYGTATAYTIGTVSKRVAGATAAATAAKELETTYDPTTAGLGATSGQCVGTTSATHNELTTSLATVGQKRVVVLATETHFQDALSSQYLAGDYKTGTLLTTTSSLPSATVAALRVEGVTRVLVVGGTFAVSTTVVDELKALPAYTCGGGHLMTTGGTTAHLKVTRLFGNTAAETAMQVAEAVPKSHIATLDLTGAYAGVNATGGDGMYNDTPARASTAPSTSGALRTAILASGTEFQDAMAASVLAYDAHQGPFLLATRKTAPSTIDAPVGLATEKGAPILLTAPTSLSSAAADALVNLTIKQVITMGGTDAVSNAVVTAVQNLGISVLRVAGKSYTDTSVQFAKLLVNTETGGLGVGWTIGSHTVTVTRGDGYTDGIAGAVVSGATHQPLLLIASPTSVGASLTAFLKASGKTTHGIDSPTRTGQTIENLTIFGGSLAVTPAVVAQMQADIA